MRLMGGQHMKKIIKLFSLVVMFILTNAIIVMADTIPEGYYRIKNVKSGMYLDCESYAKSANVRQWQYDDKAAQRFLVIETTDKYDTIHAGDAAQFVLDVNGASGENAANIQMYEYNSTSAQKWQFYTNNNGSFRIMSQCSQNNRGVVVWAASCDNGANVFQYDYNASKNDMWILEADLDEAVYYIRNKETGLYLTASQDGYSNGHMKLADLGQGQSQQFKISKNGNGYFDIAPMTDTNMSMTVTSNANNRAVNYTYGSGISGLGFKFILNDDYSSYRIVSDISNDEKALTVLGNDKNYVYSSEFTTGGNNKWEIIKVNTNEYKKEGKHVVVYVDSDQMIKKYVTSGNWNKWINNLDEAYEKYVDLVGGAPADGKKLKIVFGGEAKTYGLYTYFNQNYIIWNTIGIAEALRNINDGDWCFGVLHEIGHVFDIADSWKFDNELLANFKMAYVLKQCDGRFKLYLSNLPNQQKYITKYSELINYYKTYSDESFDKKMASDMPKFYYFNDAVTYMLLEQIENKSSWNYVKEAFRELKDAGVKVTNCSTRYKLFTGIISDKSGGKFLDEYIKAYSKQDKYIIDYLNDFNGGYVDKEKE